MDPLVSNEIARATLDSWDVAAGEHLLSDGSWLTGAMSLLMAMTKPGTLANGLCSVLFPRSMNYHYLLSAVGSELKVLQKGNRPDIVPPEWYELAGLIERRAPDMVGIDRADLRSDQLGMTMLQLAEQTGRVAAHPALLAARALRDGFSDVNFDKKPTFSTTHYIDPQNKTGAQSNSLTLALSVDSFFEAKSKMMEFVARDAQPYTTSNKWFLVVPSRLEKIGRQCVVAKTVENGGENVAEGQAQLIVSAELSAIDATRWYLLRGSGGFAPLLLLINEMPEPLMVGPGMEGYETTKQLAYGITVAWAARLGRWWQLLTSKP